MSPAALRSVSVAAPEPPGTAWRTDTGGGPRDSPGTKGPVIMAGLVPGPPVGPTRIRADAHEGIRASDLAHMLTLVKEGISEQVNPCQGPVQARDCSVPRSCRIKEDDATLVQGPCVGPVEHSWNVSELRPDQHPRSAHAAHALRR